MQENSSCPLPPPLFPLKYLKYIHLALHITNESDVILHLIESIMIYLTAGNTPPLSALSLCQRMIDAGRNLDRPGYLFIYYNRKHLFQQME